MGAAARAWIEAFRTLSVDEQTQVILAIFDEDLLSPELAESNDDAVDAEVVALWCAALARQARSMEKGRVALDPEKRERCNRKTLKH
jgi:hypothetical protein